MESSVSGKMTKVENNITQVKKQLQNLGYTVNETPDELEFKKAGYLEAVIEEISPICQALGLCQVEDLTLEENHPDLAMKRVYDHGRIVRKFPSH